MSVAKVSCIDSLSRDNYDTWKIQMKALLENESEMHTIEVQLSPVVENENPEHETPTTEQESPRLITILSHPGVPAGDPEFGELVRGEDLERYIGTGHPREVQHSLLKRYYCPRSRCHQAVRGEDADEWHKAMADEVASILKNGTGN
ncbi:unnamed protein product [Acanthoscelides obtectus]|uniref:DUF4219 domain-containing protein n=1 Tax=Acanthoscelides obtectus TaxID=200917 RepID=A0A9P0QGF6_ACAOB|nr:unnamed protein product [Acanthoscelides obtectus]CAK1689462.1 hypothetical protein AOBTE_LOCUS37272 [Acanthoscelides obtectus]